MTGYKTQSPDTHPEIEEMLFSRWRSQPSWEKLKEVAELTRSSRQLALLGLQSRYPKASPREIQIRLAALCYGRELSIQAFGWDPEKEGW